MRPLKFFFKFFIYPPVTNWLGSRVCLRIVAFALPVIYGLLPLVLLLPQSIQMPAIYVLMFFKSLCKAITPIQSGSVSLIA
jgi:hypothetical protein